MSKIIHIIQILQITHIIHTTHIITINTLKLKITSKIPIQNKMNILHIEILLKTFHHLKDKNYLLNILNKTVIIPQKEIMPKIDFQFMKTRHLVSERALPLPIMIDIYNLQLIINFTINKIIKFKLNLHLKIKTHLLNNNSNHLLIRIKFLNHPKNQAQTPQINKTQKVHLHLAK